MEFQPQPRLSRTSTGTDNLKEIRERLDGLARGQQALLTSLRRVEQAVGSSSGFVRLANFAGNAGGSDGDGGGHGGAGDGEVGGRPSLISATSPTTPYRPMSPDSGVTCTRSPIHAIGSLKSAGAGGAVGARTSGRRSRELDLAATRLELALCVDEEPEEEGGSAGGGARGAGIAMEGGVGGGDGAHSGPGNFVDTRSMKSISSYGSCAIFEGLPKDWPRGLQVRKEMLGETSRQGTRRSNQTMHTFNRDSVGMTWTFSAGINERPAKAEWFTLHPLRPLRVGLDMLTLLTLFFDLLTIPVILAWSLRPDQMWFNLNLAEAVIWTTDVLANFRTGFYRQSGAVELRGGEIARRYLMRWFLLDLILVAIDWSYVGITWNYDHIGMDVVDWANRLKIARLIRVMMISRDNRLQKILQSLGEMTAPEGLRVAVHIFELIASLVYLNHTLACVWFWLGKNAPSDTGLRWLDVVISEHSDTLYMDSGLWFQYFTALHFSFTQMTPGSMQVFPLNTAERAFNVFCLIMGVACFGSLISMLSAATARLRVMRQEQTRKLDQLHNYLCSKRVSSDLMMQIKKEAQQRLAAKRPEEAKDIALLSVLSKRLRIGVHCEACRPFLMRHPLFRCMLYLQPSSLQTLCTTDQALEFHVLAPGDLLFEAGAPAPFAFAIVNGSVKYTSVQVLLAGGAQMSSDEDIVSCTHGSWLAEICLWLQWTHMGTAEASSVSEVFALSAAVLLGAVAELPAIRRLLREFGKAYRNYLDTCPQEEAGMLDDIRVDSFERAERLIAQMPKSVRVPLARRCLRTLNVSWAWMLKRRQLQDLAQEVESGLSTLIFDEAGEVQRLVQLVALRLTRDDGRIFVELGCWQDGTLKTLCQLPGTKLRPDELSRDALKRVLQEDLDLLMPNIVLGTTACQTDVTESQRFGVKTKYIKTVLSAEYRDQEDCVGGSMDGVLGTESLTSQPSWVSLRPGPSRAPDSPDRLFVLSDGVKVMLYAWLQPDEFARLNTKNASKDSNFWLHSRLSPDQLAEKAQTALDRARSAHLTI